MERFGIPLQTDKDFELILSSLSCRVTGSDELENGDHLFLQEKGIYLSLQRSNQIALGQEEEKNDIISTQSNQERRIQAEYSEDRNFSHEENPLLENSGVVSQSDELEEHHSNY